MCRLNGWPTVVRGPREMDWPAGHRFVAELSPGARRDFLRVLTSSSEVRADVISQFHERGKEMMTELLILLDENDAARQAMIEKLQGSL